MNLREGTRRLALLLGVAGAIVGGFASYVELQTVLNQRALHNRFERLANSDVVQQERKKFQPTPDFIPDFIQAPYATIVNRGGIRNIIWGKFAIASIETDDGQTLYPTPAPTLWSYLLIAILPVLGFLIPWATIRAIGWVGAGFFQSSLPTNKT